MTNPGDASSLAGVRVAVFEARMAALTADLVRKYGGVPLAAPALREVPLGASPALTAFVDGLINNEFDVVIFETGAGVRYLTQAIETLISRETWLEGLTRTRVVARGPKPAVALRELPARVDLLVPEPNTWRQTLALLDSRLPVKGLRVALQEYGKPNLDLVEGLQGRGATVTRVPVYRWALPEDLEPLRSVIVEIAERRVEAALFTSAQQVEHLLLVAGQEGREADLRTAFSSHTVVASIGPTTSEALRASGIPVDLEPQPPKLGRLVSLLASRWLNLVKAGPQ